LVEIYNTKKPTTLLIKNISTPVFGEQQFVTNFASCFVILAHDDTNIKRLMKVHQSKIDGQDFTNNFEV
jgi:hypothetical protein